MSETKTYYFICDYEDSYEDGSVWRGTIYGASTKSSMKQELCSKKKGEKKMKNIDLAELEMEYQELENGLRAGGLSISQMHRVIHRMETIKDILVEYGIWDEE